MLVFSGFTKFVQKVYRGLHIPFIDGLQQVKEFSGGFAEGYEGFIESLAEAYEGTPSLWSCGLGPVVTVYRGFDRRF